MMTEKVGGERFLTASNASGPSPQPNHPPRATFRSGLPETAPPAVPPERPAGGTTHVRTVVSPHPLAHAAYWTCADLISLSSQLALGVIQPSEQVLRAHVDQLLRAMRSHARANGIAAEDANDMQYALIALLDEILVHANWPGRTDWYRSPLQLVYFRENTAGENFFRLTAGLCNQPHRAHVLLIFYYCLALGFRGRFGADGRGLEQVQDGIRAALQPYLEPSAPPSPHGEPPDGGPSIFRREAPILRVSASFFAIALVLFVLLRITLSVQLSRAIAPMHAYAASAEAR